MDGLDLEAFMAETERSEAAAETAPEGLTGTMDWEQKAALKLQLGAALASGAQLTDDFLYGFSLGGLVATAEGEGLDTRQPAEWLLLVQLLQGSRADMFRDLSICRAEVLATQERLDQERILSTLETAQREQQTSKEAQVD